MICWVKKNRIIIYIYIYIYYICGKTGLGPFAPLCSTTLPIMGFLHQNCGRVHGAVDLPLKNLVQDVGEGTPLQNFL